MKDLRQEYEIFVSDIKRNLPEEKRVLRILQGAQNEEKMLEALKRVLVIINPKNQVAITPEKIASLTADPADKEKIKELNELANSCLENKKFWNRCSWLAGKFSEAKALKGFPSKNASHTIFKEKTV